MKLKYLLVFTVLWTMIFHCIGLPVQSPVDSSKILPAISDDSLLNLVEYQTFQYFWKGAEPNSGMACERINLNDEYPDNDKYMVATGGSGFGIMSIIVGIERKYITRSEGIERLNKIANFLAKADRFHGAWPHWMDGKTGKVKPFGETDDGADIVETAFLAQSLLAVRQYFSEGTETEKSLAHKMDSLWRGIEWNWFTKGGESTIYWHWSPKHEWAINFAIKGYNECLILYILPSFLSNLPDKSGSLP